MKLLEITKMSVFGRGQYQMQNQNWFKGAPFSKAWICSLLSCSATYMFATVYSDYTFILSPTLKDILNCKGIGRLFASKLAFRNPSLVIAGAVLLYYSRWIERRFGTRRFVNFVAINGLLSGCVEVVLFMVISRVFHYNPASMFFACGPISVLSALYFAFLSEIPVVPYANFFGLPLSIHNLPFIVFLQLPTSGGASCVACAAGALSYLLYRYNVARVQQLSVVPPFVWPLFASPSNPVGWIAQQFASLGERDRREKILPIAATVERQRIELIDEYERRLMLGQMHQLHQQQMRMESDHQLPFLNRLFGNWNHQGERARPPSEDQIRQLMEMGFGNRQTVIHALQQSGNDASAAANALLLENSR